MKTRDIIEAMPLLQKAKLTKMKDSDKFLVIKAMREIKKVNAEYDEFSKDVLDKCKGDNHDEMVEQAKKWNDEHQSNTTAISEEERKLLAKLNGYFAEYTASVDALKQKELDKEIVISYAKLNEESFGELIASNDFTVEEIMKLEEVLA